MKVNVEYKYKILFLVGIFFTKNLFSMENPFNILPFYYTEAEKIIRGASWGKVHNLHGNCTGKGRLNQTFNTCQNCPEQEFHPSENLTMLSFHRRSGEIVAIVYAPNSECDDLLLKSYIPRRLDNGVHTDISDLIYGTVEDDSLDHSRRLNWVFSSQSEFVDAWLDPQDPF